MPNSTRHPRGARADSAFHLSSNELTATGAAHRKLLERRPVSTTAPMPSPAPTGDHAGAPRGSVSPDKSMRGNG